MIVRVSKEVLEYQLRNEIEKHFTNFFQLLFVKRCLITEVISTFDNHFVLNSSPVLE